MRKLIIIDHSHTGKSISNFVKLIDICIFKFDEIEFCNLVDNITHMQLIKSPTVLLNNIHIIKEDNINKMTGHHFSRATKQIHFTTIVNSSLEEINSIILDTSYIKNGLSLQDRISKEALCNNSNNSNNNSNKNE